MTQGPPDENLKPIPPFPSSEGPTPRERAMRAIPMMILFVFLPLAAAAANRFEKQYIEMPLGDLPIMTEYLIDLKNLIYHWPLLYLAWLVSMAMLYGNWISKEYTRMYIFNLALVLLLACAAVLTPIALYMPFVPIMCLVDGTRIETPGGSRPIESLQVGDEVLSRLSNGETATGRITACYEHRVEKFLRIEFESGSVLQVTSEHPIGTPGGWRLAGALKIGDQVLTRTGWEIIAAVQSVTESSMVYNLSVAPHENYFADGILVHNKIRRE